jgi:hypothetical protein
LQTGPFAALPRKIYRYNAVIVDRHEVDVHSVVVLLRRSADLSHITGELRIAPPHGPESVFRYTVVRLWQLPVEVLANGGLTTLPLTPLANVAPDALPPVIRRMSERLKAETTPEDAAKL